MVYLALRLFQYYLNIFLKKSVNQYVVVSFWNFRIFVKASKKFLSVRVPPAINKGKAIIKCRGSVSLMNTAAMGGKTAVEIIEYDRPILWEKIETSKPKTHKTHSGANNCKDTVIQYIKHLEEQNKRLKKEVDLLQDRLYNRSWLWEAFYIWLHY